MKPIQNPLVSIFMPVYNSQEFLSRTLNSIQAQTYANWELIAVDDWSTDHSWKILKQYADKDKRIKLYRNGKHHGVAGAANLAIPLAKGQFIARMDADDVMKPKRLEKQVTYLQTHPQVVAVGTQCQLVNREDAVIGEKRFPLRHEDIYRMIFRAIPLQQPSMMINKTLLPENYIWYREEQYTAEEVDFLFRLFQYGTLANLPQKLIDYRIHGKNTSLVDPKKTFFTTFITRLKAVNEYGYKPRMLDMFLNVVQLGVVAILPSSWIYPVYALVRTYIFNPTQSISQAILVNKSQSNSLSKRLAWLWEYANKYYR